MKLYVLGPAFGLPSIDAECTAAVALLKVFCRKHHQAWELVATHEHGSTTSLPLLVDGGCTTRGYKSIARYLAKANGDIDGLLTGLSPKQKADHAALSSFIEADGQLLLDVSLYVSFENYRLRTRPAFTRILPWWANYVLPPHRRAAAKARTEHLGVSTIDIDTVHDDLIDKPKNLKTSQKGFEHETEKRARHLLGRQNTVSSMLGKPEHAAAFRLKALSDAFFGPLRDFLGDNEYLLSTDAPSLLDCLAYGYLSLMLYPQMPQDWLATAIRKQYPSIAAYVERLRCDLDVDAEAEKVMALPTNGGKVEDGSNLPWVIPEKTAPGVVISFIGQDLFHRIPLVGSRSQVSGAQSDDQETSFLRAYMPGLLGFVSTSLALFGYWVFHNTEWPHGERVQVFGRKRLVDYGEAGAALAALGSQLQYETAYQQQQRDGPVQVDVVLDEQTAP